MHLTATGRTLPGSYALRPFAADQRSDSLPPSEPQHPGYRYASGISQESELNPTDHRVRHTATLFGVHFPLVLEPFIYATTQKFSKDYTGDLWHFYALRNGGFYIAPDDDRTFRVVCENYFEGDLSADDLPLRIQPLVIHWGHAVPSSTTG